jgi:2-polyprenyl-6-methoxyphenol hydroxylase-like FAD-dependent oxidoreductase
MYVRTDGGIGNYSGNNVNLSDQREKKDFAPAKNYLDVICNIPVQTFNYIDQSEDNPGLTLGVVAQDVQAVAPELVMESDWSTEKDGSKMRLSIYQTDLQYALMKSIQELKAINDAQATRIETLEAQNAAFETRLAALEAN